MLRPVAFTLLLVGVLSYPLALLCMDECAMPMGTGDSAGTPAQSIVQADLRECCLGPAQVAKQWQGKPQPKVKQLGGPPSLSAGLFAVAFSHALLPPAPVYQHGSPPTQMSARVLRL